MELAETSNQTEDWCGATTNTNNATPETLNDDRCAADTAAARPRIPSARAITAERSARDVNCYWCRISDRNRRGDCLAGALKLKALRKPGRATNRRFEHVANHSLALLRAAKSMAVPSLAWRTAVMSSGICSNVRRCFALSPALPTGSIQN